MSYDINSPLNVIGDIASPGRVDLSNSTFSVQLQAPIGLTANTPFIFPPTSGTLGQVVTSTGGGGTVWGSPGVGANTDIWILSDEKASGTNGGTFVSGAWRTRDLNTLSTLAGTDVTLVANQIIIQDGTYLIEGSAPAGGVNSHKSRFQNITDNVTEFGGTSERMNNNKNNRSILSGFLAVTGGPKIYEFQHACQTTRNTDGFGEAAGFAVNEIFTVLKITRLF